MAENPNMPGSSSALVDRAKAIIMTPRTEWAKIAAETKSTKDVFLSYAVPLAAIGPISGLIGGQVFGYGAFGFHYRPSLMVSLTSAITSYVLSLVGLFVIAFVANFLSPKFDGKDNFEKAFKLCAYSFTAAWLAGIFQLVPMLGILAILGFYSLYLFYVGVVPMMAVPQDKALAYTAVTVIAAIVVNFVFGLLAASMAGGFASPAAIAAADSADDVSVSMSGLKINGDGKNSTVELPGVGTVHVNEENGTMTINGTVDGKEIHANIETGE